MSNKHHTDEMHAIGAAFNSGKWTTGKIRRRAEEIIAKDDNEKRGEDAIIYFDYNEELGDNVLIYSYEGLITYIFIADHEGIIAGAKTIHTNEITIPKMFVVEEARRHEMCCNILALIDSLYGETENIKVSLSAEMSYVFADRPSPSKEEIKRLRSINEEIAKALGFTICGEFAEKKISL